MTTWTRTQIEALALSTGWGNASKDVSYVAMAESSGNDKIVNSIGAVGLLQILQPVHVKAHPTWTTKWLQDPMNNMRAGLVLYKAAGNKFDGPWLDSRDKGAGGGWGKYVKATGTSTGQGVGGDIVGAITGTGTGVVGSLVGGASDAVGGIGGAVDAGGSILKVAELAGAAGLWISNPNNWVRILYAIGGATLVITGLGIIASNTKAGQAAVGTAKSFTNAATSVIPGGGVVKGAGKAVGSKIKTKVAPPKASVKAGTK